MSYLKNFHHQISGRRESTASTPKLVFLHGVMGFAANWRRIAKAFEDEYQILTYDQRGHGRSFQPESGYGPEDYSSDLLRIIDELKWEKITLVGHSMGGRASYHFAAQHPERVTRLVIEDIGPSIDPLTGSFVLRALDLIPVPFADKRAAKTWFDGEFLRIFASEKQKEGLAAYLYANLTENDAKQAVWRFSVSGIRESVEAGRALERWEDIGRLFVPTLVVRGEHSRDLPESTFARMLEINPRIQGVEIKDAGHWVHSDQPDLFIKVLSRFFRGEEQVAEAGIAPKGL